MSDRSPGQSDVTGASDAHTPDVEVSDDKDAGRRDVGAAGSGGAHGDRGTTADGGAGKVLCGTDAHLHPPAVVVGKGGQALTGGAPLDHHRTLNGGGAHWRSI